MHPLRTDASADDDVDDAQQQMENIRLGQDEASSTTQASSKDTEVKTRQATSSTADASRRDSQVATEQRELATTDTDLVSPDGAELDTSSAAASEDPDHEDSPRPGGQDIDVQGLQRASSPASPTPPADDEAATSPSNEDSQSNKLFVGGISPKTTDDMLREHFSQFGDIDDCVCMRRNSTDGQGPIARGFGFVTFSTEEAMKNALEHEEHVVDERIVDVKPSIPKEQSKDYLSQKPEKCKLFVGGISEDTKAKDVRKAFDGVAEVTEVVVPTADDNTARGFCFVTFSSPEEAERMCRQGTLMIKGKRAELKYARPNPSQQQRNSHHHSRRHGHQHGNRHVTHREHHNHTYFHPGAAAQHGPVGHQRAVDADRHPSHHGDVSVAHAGASATATQAFSSLTAPHYQPQLFHQQQRRATSAAGQQTAVAFVQHQHQAMHAFPQGSLPFNVVYPGGFVPMAPVAAGGQQPAPLQYAIGTGFLPPQGAYYEDYSNQPLVGVAQPSSPDLHQLGALAHPSLIPPSQPFSPGQFVYATDATYFTFPATDRFGNYGTWS